MSTRHHVSRTDLFLVRVWTRDAQDGTGKCVYSGKVQRVVDGESHQFHEMSDLLKLLAAMLESRRNKTDGDPSND